ncbi:hypothetical protein [uncultured Eubacterium sp.]|uniref:hypothetical protein n=1 Tax=uncultured Eubacterium sp. TaxID=165185 RepID=UPI0034533DAF
MGKIYCLMGKSASGKDTIYNRLLAMEELQLRRVVPYTTRPIRSGETEGESYFFCSESVSRNLNMRAGSSNCGHTIPCMACGNILPQMTDRLFWQKVII